MNAQCYCGHKLAQHKSDGECCMCGCDKFTEKISHHCPVCNEPILIRDAPNELIERLYYKDDGKNYVHVKCKSKLPRSPFRRPEPKDKPKWGDPGDKWKMKAKQFTSDAAAFVLTKDDLHNLVSLLGSVGVYDETGDEISEDITHEPCRVLLRDLLQKIEELVAEEKYNDPNGI